MELSDVTVMKEGESHTMQVMKTLMRPEVHKQDIFPLNWLIIF